MEAHYFIHFIVALKVKLLRKMASSYHILACGLIRLLVLLSFNRLILLSELSTFSALNLSTLKVFIFKRKAYDLNLV